MIIIRFFTTLILIGLSGLTLVGESEWQPAVPLQDDGSMQENFVPEPMDITIEPVRQVEPADPEQPVDSIDLSDTSTLAQCITNSGAKFYGAFWCPHCDEQKEMFGDAMQYIEYIECDERGENAQADLCLANNIQSYPTWILGDGKRLIGTRPLEELAQQAGCL